MPGRQKFTVVEALIIAAILGVLASIALPAMEQSRRRARPQQLPAASAPARSADGQLNIIEVSELAQAERESRSVPLFEIVAGLLPIAFAAVVIAAIFRRLREHMSGRLGP